MKAMVAVLLTIPAAAAQMSPAAGAEFDRYTAIVERQLTFPGLPARSRIEPVNGGTRPVSGALLHHWRGTDFVSGATPADMLGLLRDYSALPKNYSPEIISARVIEDRGNSARIAVRMKEQRLVTIVLDAEYRVQSSATAERGFSYSRSTRIRQVENAGSRSERMLPDGDDDGFLWRLNSYWTFARAEDGVAIQCEAVSLTRDIPNGLGWLITPLIAEVPRNELEFTLRATAKALKEARK